MIVLCDIDGTISDHSGRFHHVSGPVKNWPSYYGAMGDDPPIPAAQKVLPRLAKMLGQNLVFHTGRPSTYRDVTCEWLLRHFDIDLTPKTLADVITIPRIVMRKEGDYRPAVVYKEELLSFLFGGGSMPAPLGRHPVLILDDDLRNAEMYSRYGIFLKAPECWEVFR